MSGNNSRAPALPDTKSRGPVVSKSKQSSGIVAYVPEDGKTQTRHKNFNKSNWGYCADGTVGWSSESYSDTIVETTTQKWTPVRDQNN